MSDISITAASVLATASTVKEAGIGGEAITAGKQVYLSSTTAKYMLADSNSATVEARAARGTALNNCADGQPLVIGRGGKVAFGAVFTAGVAYYLSDTPGGICPVADVGSGEYSQIVGMADSTSELDLVYKASGVAL